MSMEGYLIRHGHVTSEILFCQLADGKVIFYDSRGGQLIEEISLSRTKLIVRGVSPSDAFGCEHSFLVNMRRSQLINGRQSPVGPQAEFLLSATSNQDRKDWGNAIHSWQRHYWKDPLHTHLNMSEAEEAKYFENQYVTLYDMLETTLRGKDLPKIVPRQTNTDDIDHVRSSNRPYSVHLRAISIA
jgi:hypothetical protein